MSVLFLYAAIVVQRAGPRKAGDTRLIFFKLVVIASVYEAS